ncbi:hypothetical protein ANAPC5_01506 [Anaplasma phagocytophilum]|nr:hypothetical protein ANAPC5_01506 [Anaplasma phagocytophilum]
METSAQGPSRDARTSGRNSYGELRCSGDLSEVPQAADLARCRDGDQDRQSRLRWRLVVSINKGAIQTDRRRFTPGVSCPRRVLGHPGW